MRVDGVGEFGLVGADAARRQIVLREEAFRIIVGLGLRVLAQRQRHRAAFGGVGEHGHGALQRGDDLLGPRDAVEIARDRAEAVVGRHRAVGEVFDLLQHRIGPAVGENVAGQKQHRQAVHMGDCGGRHHVGGAGADGGGAGHHAPAARGLGEGDGRMRHALLVMGAKVGSVVAHPVQRLAHARDVAVAENRPHAAEERQDLSVDLGLLRRQESGEGLRHGQADRAHACSSEIASQGFQVFPS